MSCNATLERPRGKSNRFVSSSYATERVRKWQAPGRKAKKYSPTTIREAQIELSEVFGRLRFNT